MDMKTTTNETVTGRPGRPCSRCLSHGTLITRVALSEDSDEVGEEVTCPDCLGTGTLMCECGRGSAVIDLAGPNGKTQPACVECRDEVEALIKATDAEIGFIALAGPRVA